MKKAIFLAGGGARGAYQAGALRCISDILGQSKFPVDILSTVSAGAINGTKLAMHADDFNVATQTLIDLWSNLSCDKIFLDGNADLLKSVARNMASMVFHMNWIGGQHLFDTKPLRKLLCDEVDFNRINLNIEKGLLSAFEVATTCFESSQTISFVHSQGHYEGWRKIRHYSESAKISHKHIMASSAFPMIFPVARIGNLHYGVGGLRQAAPLRASIKLGAEAILIIGTRKTPTEDGFLHPKPIVDINFAKILGSLFNAFLDNLDRDLELMQTINTNYQLMDKAAREKSAWREIKTLHLSPSKDLAKIAVEKEISMPFLLRYLMDAFGHKQQSGDFLSFLLFESEYTKELIDIGYNDTMQRKTEVEAFFAL